ncbi:MAG: DNA alkylation repair protein [Bacteroidota bacterium]
MPEPLKNIFNPGFIKKLSVSLKKQFPSFHEKEFSKDVLFKDWEQLELKQRIRHISLMMDRHIEGNYAQKVKGLYVPSAEFNSLHGFVFPDFVEVFGMNDFDTSLKALEHFTKYSTGEFAIRPFLIRDQERTMKKMYEWSKNNNHHIRRLSSEGCRPRLPWAMAIPALKKDPSPILPIIETLKADKEDYVYRSVANNLNDISKDHPELVLETCKKWKNVHPHTDWVIKHACRTLLKKGNPKALSLMGISHKAEFKADRLQLSSKKVKIGGFFHFSFTLVSSSQKKQKARIEYAIDFVKKGQKLSRKIFHLRQAELLPGEIISLSKKHSFANLTTRQHYPGEHRLTILVNGIPLIHAVFKLQ